MFFCYLIIQSVFMDDKIKALEYAKNLDDVMVKQDGIKLIPELYTVRAEDSELEACEPGSQVGRRTKETGFGTNICASNPRQCDGTTFGPLHILIC